MFALNIMSLATGNGTYNEWAVEMAQGTDTSDAVL